MGLTRADVAFGVCQHFGWRRVDGTLAVDSCRLFLARLAGRGLLRLPEPRRKGNFSRPMQLDPLIDSQFPSVTEKRAYSGELSLRHPDLPP